MAVGQSIAGFAGDNQEALAEGWNGASFSLLSAPPDASNLLGVSCASGSACVAVGVDAVSGVSSGPAIDSWNGSGWTSQAPADGAFELTAVSCATVTDCMALGVNEANNAISEYFNGTSWALEPLPAKANPIAIDCPTIARCIAVGTGTIDYWNPTCDKLVRTWRPSAVVKMMREPPPGRVAALLAIHSTQNSFPSGSATTM